MKQLNNETMKLGIDARMYGTAHGGIGRYVKELIINLSKIDSENQYIFLKPPYRWYSLKEQLMMPKLIKKTGVDLVHFPHFNVPLKLTIPFVVTIHDLIIHHFPNERATTLPKWLYNLKLKGYKKVMQHAVVNSRAVIVPSQATKKDVLKFYNVDEDKIKVICNGVSKLQITNYKLNKNLKFKIKNYILHVGSFYPHKNIEKLIDAFLILRQKYKLDVSLVFAGKKDYFYQQLRNHIDNNEAMKQWNNETIFYDHASDIELAQLYSNAKLFVFPSLYEGFGLPPLEAMSLGTPVVASNASSIPEICGQAAFYFDPNNIDDMAAKIYTAYTDKSLREKLIANSAAHIKKFSWTQMAQETFDLYKEFM